MELLAFTAIAAVISVLAMAFGIEERPGFGDNRDARDSEDAYE